MEEHSRQLASQASHRPVVKEPYWPAGQKVEQLEPLKELLSRNGAPEVAAQAVQEFGSSGAVHEAHAGLHGLQKPVALDAKPGGHVARHRPRCVNGTLLVWLHERQLEASGPSHVAHDGWQLPHVLLEVTYMPAPQTAASLV